MSGVFQRLIGLETEYAIRARSPERAGSPRSKFRHYEALVTALRRRVPAVPAKHFKEGVFTANGGAVWFEAERPAAGGGMIEGSTPECHGPREAVLYQRAQDRLLGECAENCRFQLIKNDRDACDNVYGAQENYEATIATGLDLFLWRLGLVLAFPLTLLTWVGMLLFIVATFAYFVLAGFVYLPLKLLTGSRESVALLLFGSDLIEGREHCIHIPVWLESTLQIATRILTAPLAVALYLLLKATAFRSIRRRLVPFLVSRPLVAGAGMIDAAGDFFLSDKGPAVNCLIGFGGMIGDRPMFSMGHFFKTAYADSWFSPREYFDLFRRRHRLQIGLGDSNMCETAEYLRVGTTLLVLDAIESGTFAHPPRVTRPIRALHRICEDATLKAQVRLRDGQDVTALQLQRYYLAGCRAFLNQQQRVPAEAWDVVQRWEQTLDGFEEVDAKGQLPESLVGIVDWVTKQYLLNEAGADANWVERKKIDLRYHELSADGYYTMLQSSGLVPRVVTEATVERAMRSAPANSPATTRGHYIREFAHGDQPVTANWKVLAIGRGWAAKVVRLSHYGRQGRRGQGNSDAVASGQQSRDAD